MNVFNDLDVCMHEMIMALVYKESNNNLYSQGMSFEVHVMQMSMLYDRGESWALALEEVR